MNEAQTISLPFLGATLVGANPFLESCVEGTIEHPLSTGDSVFGQDVLDLQDEFRGGMGPPVQRFSRADAADYLAR